MTLDFPAALPITSDMITIIEGPPGIGKTTLAKALKETNDESYRLTRIIDDGRAHLSAEQEQWLTQSGAEVILVAEANCWRQVLDDLKVTADRIIRMDRPGWSFQP